MRSRRTSQRREPTIALINIVFLMLVFFMVAGTLAPSLDREIRLVNTSDIDGVAPADALVLHADGSLSQRGTAIADVAAFLADVPEEARDTIRLLPDQSVPAERLLEVGAALRAQGAERILIVTERGLQ